MILAAIFHTQRRTGITGVRQVDGGLWQARCVCRWHGRRRRARGDALTDAAEHEPDCGRCIRDGRAGMHTCSCMNCQHRRAARATPPPADERTG